MYRRHGGRCTDARFVILHIAEASGYTHLRQGIISSLEVHALIHLQGRRQETHQIGNFTS